MTSATLHRPFVSAVNLLGGESVLLARPRVVMDWIPLVRQGLPSATVDAEVRITREHYQFVPDVRTCTARAPTVARRRRTHSHYGNSASSFCAERSGVAESTTDDNGRGTWLLDAAEPIRLCRCSGTNG